MNFSELKSIGNVYLRNEWHTDRHCVAIKIDDVGYSCLWSGRRRIDLTESVRDRIYNPAMHGGYLYIDSEQPNTLKFLPEREFFRVWRNQSESYQPVRNSSTSVFERVVML